MAITFSPAKRVFREPVAAAFWRRLLPRGTSQPPRHLSLVTPFRRHYKARAS
jgi:hypothetical protein